MKISHLDGVGMTLKDVLRNREVGEQVISHVLEDAKEPTPDFEAMKKALSESAPARNAPAYDDSERSVP